MAYPVLCSIAIEHRHSHIALTHLALDQQTESVLAFPLIRSIYSYEFVGESYEYMFYCTRILFCNILRIANVIGLLPRSVQ